MTVRTAKPRVLCVDDEPELLSGVKLVLRKRFEVVTAESGPDALAILEVDEPFDVVISDMRMPQMSGAQFLQTVRELYPDLPRLLLSGQSDLDAAISAINDAKIFRFLTKPCPPPVLIEAIDEAIEQARLRNVEKELLDRTLKGTVDMLTDVLNLVDAEASSRAGRIKATVHRICHELNRPISWELDLAAMLSQIGFVVLPDTGAEGDGSELADELSQQRLILASELLINVPRLQPVASLIRCQLDREPLRTDETIAHWSDRELDSEVLRLAARFDTLVANGVSPGEAIDTIKADPVPPPGFALDAMGPLRAGEEEMAELEVTVRKLEPGMLLAADLFLATGPMLAGPGTELTAELIGRIKSFAKTAGVVEPIQVRVPAALAQKLDGARTR